MSAVLNSKTDSAAAETNKGQQLPPNWQLMAVSELGRWKGGGTPSKSKLQFWTNGTIPWVSPKDMKTDRILDSEDHITPEAIANSSTNLVNRGAVLIVVRSGILQHSLPVAVTDCEVALNQDLKALELRDELLPDYVAWGLRTFAQEILHSCSKTGTTVQSIEFPSFLRYRIPVAPLGEQHRIVAEIEKQFTRLDAGVASLKRVQIALKRYRASVLKAACEGRLVITKAELVQQAGIGKVLLETGEHLLHQILADRRKNWKSLGKYKEPVTLDVAKLPSLPEDWTWASIEQLLVEPLCNGISVKGSDNPPGVRALRLSAMSDSGFDFSDARYLPLSESEVNDLWIKQGDFFMSRGNGSLHLVGRGTSAQNPPELTIFPDTMIRLRLTKAIRASGWVRTIWPSHIFRSQIERKVKTTAGIYKIAQPQVEQLVLPLPPLAEQVRIVAEVERRMSILEALRIVVTVNLKRAERLRQSILHRAFSGNL
jgi:type I restriction enzyme S subunit